MVKLPGPTLKVLDLLNKKGSLTPNQIQADIPEFKPKDIKYALRRLREKGVLIKIPNLIDMRRVYYRLASQDEFLNALSKIKSEELKLYQDVIGGAYATEIIHQTEIKI